MKKATKVNPESIKRLKSLLSRNGVTQTQLCTDTHISQNTISKIMNGKAPLTPYVAGEIIKRFPGTSYEWLMGNSHFETESIKDAYSALKPALERIRRRKAVDSFFHSFNLSFSVNVADSSSFNESTDEFLDRATADDIQKAFVELESVQQSPKVYVIKKDGEIWGYCSEEEKRILFEEIVDFAEFSLLKLCNRGGQENG